MVKTGYALTQMLRNNNVSDTKVAALIYDNVEAMKRIMLGFVRIDVCAEKTIESA